MFKTRFAAAFAACLATLALALTVAAGAAAPAKATSRPRAVCANKLCTRDLPGRPSCRRFHKDTRMAKCFIRRAADHFHQSRRQALYIAHRESHYHPGITNPSSGTAGLYQFARATWESTPYHRHSPYQPRWASLGAMYMWAHGGAYHWRV